MWEMISFAAGMVVLMLLVAILPHIFDLPEAIGRYFSRRSQKSDAGLLPRDPGEVAARVLGEALRRAELSEDAVAQVTAAFWAADDRNRRALAHLLGGMSADGPGVDEDVVLTLGRGLGGLGASPGRRQEPADFHGLPRDARAPEVTAAGEGKGRREKGTS